MTNNRKAAREFFARFYDNLDGTMNIECKPITKEVLEGEPDWRGLCDEFSSLLKLAQREERDKVFEDCGCPGFDGPMTIRTKYDDALEKYREAVK